MVKNLPTSAGDRCDPLVRKIPWRRKWQPSLVFFPGESHEQRSLMGYSPWGSKRVGQDLATKHQGVRHYSKLLSMCGGLEFTEWPRGLDQEHSCRASSSVSSDPVTVAETRLGIVPTKRN